MNKMELLSALSCFVLRTKQFLDQASEAEDRRVYRLYLAQAGVILAKVVQGEEIGDEVATLEHIFGSLWLSDAGAYAEAYAAWDDFRALVTRSIRGLTLEERLAALGLSTEFGWAVKRRDETRARMILAKCLLDDAQIESALAAG